MKKIYLVLGTNYEKTPLFATDSYNDAIHFAAVFKKDFDDESASKRVLTLPYMTNTAETINPEDVDSLVDHTIDATIKAYQAVENHKAGDSDE